MIPNLVPTCLNIIPYEKEQQQSMGIMPRMTTKSVGTEQCSVPTQIIAEPRQKKQGCIVCAAPVLR